MPRLRALTLSLSLGCAALSTPACAQALFNTGGGLFAAPVTSLRDMPFRQVVRQQYDYSCGSAALATLLRHHYGREVGEAAIFKAMYSQGDQAKIRQVGFSLLDMQRYLGGLGYEAHGYRMSLDQLRAQTAPAIALIQTGAYRHFVVVKGLRGDEVLVGDPNKGLRTYSAETWAKVWDGVIFQIRTGPSAARAYDSDEAWESLRPGPANRLDHRSIGSLTLALPAIDQITAGGMIVGGMR